VTEFTTSVPGLFSPNTLPLWFACGATVRKFKPEEQGIVFLESGKFLYELPKKPAKNEAMQLMQLHPNSTQKR
jgi:hypothetical protein